MMLSGYARGSITLNLLCALFPFLNTIVREIMLGQMDFWPDSAMLKQVSPYCSEMMF